MIKLLYDILTGFLNKTVKFLLLSCFLLGFNLQAHDILIEAKTAAYFPTSSQFKNIYNSCGGIYGVELTGRIKEQWYGFVSTDFFSKHGQSLGFNTPTRAKINNVGLGLKYFMPFESGDLYLGLGILPTRLHTVDSSPFVPNLHTKWDCGGIAKAGLILNLTNNSFLDFFFDYAFAKANFKAVSGMLTQLHSAKLNSCWLGIGIGWRL